MGWLKRNWKKVVTIVAAGVGGYLGGAEGAVLAAAASHLGDKAAAAQAYQAGQVAQGVVDRARK